MRCICRPPFSGGPQEAIIPEAMPPEVEGCKESPFPKADRKPKRGPSVNQDYKQKALLGESTFVCVRGFLVLGANLVISKE